MENWIEPEVVFSTKKGKFCRTCTSFSNPFFSFSVSWVSFLSTCSNKVCLCDFSSIQAHMKLFAWLPHLQTVIKTPLKQTQVSGCMQFNSGQMFCNYSSLSIQEQNTHMNTSFSSSVSFQRRHLVFNKGCKQIKENVYSHYTFCKSGNDKKFENLLALGRWGFIKSLLKPQNPPPSFFFFP